MHTDPIADLLTRIRNAQRAHHDELVCPHSRVKDQILKILKSKGCIQDYKEEADGSFKNTRIKLIEEGKALSLKRISKPGQRIYVKGSELRSVKSGLGFRIVSTSKGMMTNSEAKKQNIGGELICEVC